MKWNDIYWIFQTFLTNHKLKNWVCKIIWAQTWIVRTLQAVSAVDRTSKGAELQSVRKCYS
jgi:hypothetical protein